jgi:hypothetical protein
MNYSTNDIRERRYPVSETQQVIDGLVDEVERLRVSPCPSCGYTPRGPDPQRVDEELRNALAEEKELTDNEFAAEEATWD